MVGVAAQYLLMPLMTTYLGWSDTIILIVRLFSLKKEICFK